MFYIVNSFEFPDPWLVIPQSFWHWKLHKTWLYHINYLSSIREIHMGRGKPIYLYLKCGLLVLIPGNSLLYCCCLQLCSDLSSSLTRLLNASNDSFWRTGWVYTRVNHHVAFIYDGLFLLSVFFIRFIDVIFSYRLSVISNTASCRVIIWFSFICAAGQVVLGTSIPLTRHKNCRILSIKPIAISVSDSAQFLVKGFNLSQPTTRYPSSILRVRHHCSYTQHFESEVYNAFLFWHLWVTACFQVVFSVSGCSVH